MLVNFYFSNLFLYVSASELLIPIVFLIVPMYRSRAILSRGLYTFYPIFTAVHIVERLVLHTIYVLIVEILQCLSLKSAVYNGACTVYRRTKCRHFLLTFGRMVP